MIHRFKQKHTYAHTHTTHVNTYTPAATHPTHCAGHTQQSHTQMEHAHTHNVVYA